MDIVVSSVLQLFTPVPLLLMLFGCVVGIIFGAIPGLSG